MALTQNAVQTAKPDGSERVLWDKTVPGFGCRIRSSGKKTFVLKYRTQDGRRRQLTIGGFPALNVKDARDSASRAYAAVRAGSDPVADRKQERRGGPSITVSDLLERWFDEYAKAYRKTWKDDGWRIKAKILPSLGHLRIDEIRPEDVKVMHLQIAGTVESPKAPIEANRTVELLRACWNWAVEDAELTTIRNPVPHSRRRGRKWKAPERQRDRYVTKEEMPRLIAALDAEPHLWARGALWLILLTGLRKTDVLRRTWNDVDLSARTLLVRNATKTRGLDRMVPLSHLALEKLEAIPRQRGVPWIVCSTRAGKPLLDVKAQWGRIRSAADLEDVTIHDLRRTVGSWLTQDGHSEAIRQAVLGHKRSSVTDRYSQLDLETVRSALDRFAELVSDVLTAP